MSQLFVDEKQQFSLSLILLLRISIQEFFDQQTAHLELAIMWSIRIAIYLKLLIALSKQFSLVSLSSFQQNSRACFSITLESLSRMARNVCEVPLRNSHQGWQAWSVLKSLESYSKTPTQLTHFFGCNRALNSFPLWTKEGCLKPISFLVWNLSVLKEEAEKVDCQSGPRFA